MGYGVRGLGLGVWGHRYWDWGCGSGYDCHEERKSKDVGDTLKIEVPTLNFTHSVHIEPDSHVVTAH